MTILDNDSKDLIGEKIGVGQHSRKPWLMRKETWNDYKKRIKTFNYLENFYYIPANQLRRVIDKPGISIDDVVKLLESRLDSVVYRLGIASTRAMARQFISHENVLVNGRIRKNPAFIVKIGDKIEISPDLRSNSIVLDNLKSELDPSTFVSFNKESFSGTLTRYPKMADIREEVISSIRYMIE